MKKLAFALIASCAFVQSAFSLETRLNESLTPFREMIDSELLQNRLQAGDFILGVQRITPGLNKRGKVFYKIDVRRGNGRRNLEADCSSIPSTRDARCNIISFIATFSVTNPIDIGSPIYTLERIRRLRNNELNNSNSSFDNNSSDSSSSSW